MQPQNRLVLLGRPCALFEGWVQVVTPALAALFAGTPREHGRDTCPVLAAVLADELDELLILASAPWPCASDRPGGAASANTRARGQRTCRARGQRTCEPPTTSKHRGRRSKHVGAVPSNLGGVSALSFKPCEDKAGVDARTRACAARRLTGCARPMRRMGAGARAPPPG